MKPDHRALPSLLELHDIPDASRYRSLLRDARRSHRCPVLLHDVTLERCGMSTVADQEQSVDVDVDVDDADPFAVLAAWWPGPCLPTCPCDDPLGELPAPIRVGRDLSRHPATIAGATAFVRDATGLARMAVVDATRAADVPLALQWSGMCNYFDRDLARATAVLRSWEERFGAVVVFFGPATLVLSVARPPRTVADSEAVAAEHFAFCPDQVDPQDGTGPLSIPRYAESVRGDVNWRFWWD